MKPPKVLAHCFKMLHWVNLRVAQAWSAEDGKLHAEVGTQHTISMKFYEYSVVL